MSYKKNCSIILHDLRGWLYSEYAEVLTTNILGTCLRNIPYSPSPRHRPRGETPTPAEARHTQVGETFATNDSDKTSEDSSKVALKEIANINHE